MVGVSKAAISAITTLLHGSNTPLLPPLYLRNVASVDLGSIAFDTLPVRAGRATIWAVSIGERMLAGALLLLVLPILALASIAIIALSRRSPLVAHQRVGHSGRPIWVLKLRTMWNSDSETRSLFIHRLSPVEAKLLPPGLKSVGVSSRFAAFCRRYSLDELPQLWQVVRGEMALVGPRPLTRQELDTYYGADANRIAAAKPGISGLWQISGRSRLSYAQRRRLDLFLVRKWSVPLYLRILFITLPRVLAGKDAW
jgi:lipopolysaccharide/colanic/teichoic acid biosynthesis glycosyltransferase